MKALTTLLITLGIAHFSYGSETKVTIKTKKGKSIEAVVHYPNSNQALPAVVIGPGRGYQMEYRLIKGLAEEVAKKGYIAARFNWNFYTNKKKPSKDLIEELEDYSAVVNYLKSNKRVNPAKIVTIGKSLGSVVSYRYFEQNPSIIGLILMTPICTNYFDKDGKKLSKAEPIGEKYYPKLTTEKRQIVMALGDKDPSCQLPMLYKYLTSTKETIPTIVVEGDHSMNIGKWNDPKFKKRNLENNNAAIAMISHWVDLIFKR